MKLILKKIFPFIPLLIVILLSIIVVVSTYVPGTILSGWDTLHPEFNLELYTNRVIWGAWQDHQGLGAVAAQAHLAELIRLPILWLLTKTVGVNLVRYVFILSMYIIGGISTYWFIRYVWFHKKTKFRYSIAAALGSLLYLFNLGTLQQFHVPLEMFAIHFATFGLVLGSLHLFILKGEKKMAYFLFLAQLIAAPSAHTATLFYVYTILIIGYGCLLVVLNKENLIQNIKRLFIAISLIIISNLYWLGPNLYYALNNSHELQTAKINRNFSDEAFWQNQAFGEVKNVVTFKNFLFNWEVYNFKTQKFEQMFSSWNKHLASLGNYWSYFLGIIFILGISSTFGKKRKKKLPLLLIFLLGFLFLNNLNWPSNSLYKIIISLSETLKEALRFPFTKFSIVFIFAASVYLAEFSNFLLEKISKLKNKQLKIITSAIVTSILIFGIIYPMKPLLRGGLLSEQVKVNIPTEYFEMFDWFSIQQNSGKIAMFPIVDFWPWTYYNWSNKNQINGYQGGGFTWFGLKQPLLNREFDRWAPQNENFYYEINNAILNNDQKQFSQIIEKYDVQWLLYDDNIFDPQEVERKNRATTDIEVQKDTFQNFIAKQNNILFKKTFGDIQIYSVKKPEIETVETISNLQNKVIKDFAYEEKGQYVVNQNFDSNYIFSDLLSEKIKTLVTKTNNSWEIKKEISDYDKLLLPNWNNTNSFLPVQIFATVNGTDINLKIASILPQIKTNEQSLQLNSFAKNKEINQKEKFSFADEFYQVNIAKGSEILDPRNPKEQSIGIAFIQQGKNLEIVFSASYDERTQKIIIPKEDLQSLFPTEKEINLNKKTDTVLLSYTQNLVDTLINKVNLNQSYFEQNCSKKGNVKFTNNLNTQTLRAEDGGIACQGFIINNLPLGDGYLLSTETQNLSGPNLYFQSNELGKTKVFFQETPNINTITNFYGLFPQNNNDLSLVAVNRSFGSFKAENSINTIELLAIPFEYFGKITANKNPSTQDKIEVLTSFKPKKNDVYTFIKNSSNDSGIIILEQSFDTGWIAVSIEKPLKKLPHYTFNSWANAWEINSDDNYILIFFWPQLFVWFGFGAILVTVFWLSRYNSNTKKKPSFSFKKIRSVFYEK